MKKITKLLLAIVLFMKMYLHANEIYSEYWQRFNFEVFHRDIFSTSTLFDFRTENRFKNIRVIQASLRGAAEVHKNFTLELHYTYIHDKSIDPHSIWKWQHRLEIEGNFRFDFYKKNFIETRNRIEVKREKYLSKTQYRARQRITFKFPIENVGPLKYYSIHNEIFYDFETTRFNQDRFCPLSLTFDLNKKINLEIFFLVRFFQSNGFNQQSAVLGSQLNF